MRVGDTRSASSEERVWIVPASLRARLAEQYGPVYSGKKADKHILGLKLFGTCGDRVTALAIALGHPPLIGIVDYKTRRHEPIDEGTMVSLGARRRVRVRNPPGMLTEELRRAVREVVASGGGLVEVDGEEDMGSLALVESLPLGATVIYGIPGVGATFVPVTAEAKERVRKLIGLMETRRVRLGA